MDTPETDKAERMAYAGEYMVPTEVARRLERERDEAQTEIQRLRYESQREAEHHDKMVGELEKVYAERDEWAAMCGQYKQERNDAREMLMQYMFDRSGTWIDFLPADKPTP